MEGKVVVSGLGAGGDLESCRQMDKRRTKHGQVGEATEADCITEQVTAPFYSAACWRPCGEWDEWEELELGRFDGATEGKRGPPGTANLHGESRQSASLSQNGTGGVMDRMRRRPPSLRPPDRPGPNCRQSAAITTPPARPSQGSGASSCGAMEGEQIGGK